MTNIQKRIIDFTFHLNKYLCYIKGETAAVQKFYRYFVSNVDLTLTDWSRTLLIKLVTKKSFNHFSLYFKGNIPTSRTIRRR